MRIYKYKIPAPIADGVSTVEMPKFATILSVGIQQDEMVLWAVVDPKTIVRKYHLQLVNTGNDVPEGTGEFIGTATSSNGIVWHVFKRNRQ